MPLTLSSFTSGNVRFSSTTGVGVGVAAARPVVSGVGAGGVGDAEAVGDGVGVGVPRDGGAAPRASARLPGVDVGCAPVVDPRDVVDAVSDGGFGVAGGFAAGVGDGDEIVAAGVAVTSDGGAGDGTAADVDPVGDGAGGADASAPGAVAGVSVGVGVGVEVAAGAATSAETGAACRCERTHMTMRIAPRRTTIAPSAMLSVLLPPLFAAAGRAGLAAGAGAGAAGGTTAGVPPVGGGTGCCAVRPDWVTRDAVSPPYAGGSEWPPAGIDPEDWPGQVGCGVAAVGMGRAGVCSSSVGPDGLYAPVIGSPARHRENDS